MNNYCCDNYDLAEDEIDEFRYSTRRVGELRLISLFSLEGLENLDTFYYVILYDLRCKKENSKDTCNNDDQLKQDIENNKLFEVLLKVKVDLRLNLDYSKC